ncbi:MAG: FAD-dependent oxidoreductase [Pseudomonadota bacterium]|nr:FAD-dependent oxidoreductase [Pseudomonadota bacterium]
MRIAIVGAGMAGLACAGRLSGLADIVLFDKGRRPGGRLTSVVTDISSWDLGAPFFTAREPDFQAEVARWQDAGCAARWPGGPRGAMVGVPTMATLVAEQSKRFVVRFGARVQALVRDEDGWRIEGEGLDAEPFDSVVVAVPAEQAAPLLSLHDLDEGLEAASVRSTPCWSVMVAFPWDIPAPRSFMADLGIFSVLACNASKPERGPSHGWVLHANAAWSRANLECEAEDVAERMLAEFAQALGTELPAPTFLKAHRWRFAQPYGQSGRVLWNLEQRLGACGDWCRAPTVEGAWLSGVRLADQMRASLPELITQAAALHGAG